jgi:hypothetical protein
MKKGDGDGQKGFLLPSGVTGKTQPKESLITGRSCSGVGRWHYKERVLE